MKNLYIGLISTTLLFSCNAASEKTENHASSTNEVSADTTAIADQMDENSEDMNLVFATLEDYAILDTKDMLIEAFGTENIVDGTSWYGEGSMELNHSVLTNPNNGHIIKYVWQEENPNKLSFLEVYGNIRNADYEVIGTQKIETACGLYTGMTIKEMKKWNGADFEFSGFGWDFGGMVRQAEGSKFLNCNLSLTLDLKYQPDPSDEYNQLYGDTDLSTSNEVAFNAPITLDFITLFVD
jgi:hypothetical protein